MNVLEKILEEIEKEQNSYEADHAWNYSKGLEYAKEIIRSHMDDGKDINATHSDAPYITLTLNEDGVAEVYDDTYDVTIHCESEEEQERVVGILERYQGWIPVEDTEHTPENESYVLVSFSNFYHPDIARYEENDEGGTYYPGDDEKSYLNYGLFVNAWMPLPELYRPEEQKSAKNTQQEMEDFWRDK